MTSIDEDNIRPSSDVDRDQVDSDYEGICKPPILRQLRNILDQYPDGSQIIRELVQNAEDAGASTFKIFYKEGSNETGPGASDSRYTNYFRTPALCVHNDGVFSEEDWKGIKSIYTSVKEKDALKVGRFGLGFKSIFHITDSPIIISGDKLLIINPLELPHRVCHKIPFRKLKSDKYKEAWSLMKRTLGLEGEGLFGLNEAAIDNEHYPKTLFWFPLRQKESELSNKIYTTDKMTELFESFEEEAETILLFLKSVILISIYDSQFQKKFEVQMKGTRDEDITEKREYIKNKITTNGIPTESLWSQYKAALITWKADTSESLQEWLIINHFQGTKDMSNRMYTLAQDEQLGYAPYVGLAFPLTRIEGKTFSGHVFCFLPLPIEPDGKSMTNLPVHVNGFFALTSNRRHMLWETHDQHEADDNRLVWNKLMISELLSTAYIRLVEVLLDDSNISPEVVYSSLPDAENIDPKWSILLQPVYKNVFGLNLFHTESRKRLCFEDALFFRFDQTRKKISPEIEETLWNVLTKYSENVVCLPRHLQFAILQTYLLPKGTKARTINAELICQFLRNDPLYQSFSIAQKLNIFQYILDNTIVDNFLDLDLLPTNDPTKCVSLKSAKEQIYICLHGEEKMFPQIEERLVSFIPENLKRRLINVEELGAYSIKYFQSTDFATLLEKSMEKQNIGNDIQKEHQSFVSSWISEVWRYLSDHEELTQSVQHLCILPETQKDNNACIVRLHMLEGLYMFRKHVTTTIPESVCKVLQSFNVIMLSTLPGYLPNASIERYVHFPTVSGVCDILETTLQRITDHECLIESFETLSAKTRKSFAIFLSQTGDINSFVESFLKKLKMFPVIAEKSYTISSSLSVVKNLAPQNYKEYPVPFPYPLIDGEFEGARLVLTLGYYRVKDDKLTMDVLNKINGQDFYNNKETELFMEYFLNKIESATEEQICIASKISFVYSEDGVRRLPRELFELTEDMQMLFYEEKNKLPRDNEFIKKHVNGLRLLGLKSFRDISKDDLMQTLTSLTNMSENIYNQQLILKIRSFEKFVNRFVGNANKQEEKVQSLLEKMKKSCWMTKRKIKPKHYPPNMRWFGESENLEIPCTMFHPDYEMLVGSVGMIAESCLNREILDDLLKEKPTFKQVQDQLHHLSECYRDCTNHSEFLHILSEIYDFLASENISQLTVESCKESPIIWTGNSFAKPKEVFIDHISDVELTLEPYMYKLHAEKEAHKSLFSRLGCLTKLKVKDLLHILDMIKVCQNSSNNLRSTTKHNLLVVEGILNVLEELNDDNGLSEDEKERILFPVESLSNCFELLPAKECTYVDYRRDMDETEDEEEDLKYVHNKIRSSVAENLGVPSLTRRIVEIKGVEDIPWGQKEELTDRLKNLIEEYADGTSVLKEMLQNADDAGATSLRILFDERRNENALDRLIDKGMVECQGPAIWVYNNAKFSKEDFENIIKLGAGTKETDMTKIGKFGLGFCSVYNITDMPSVLSGESLVILDPRMIHLGKALKNNNPGLRFKISDSKTRYRLRNQIRPFNGVFGCDFENDFTSYEGTLFRLPLRTAKQADETKNQISSRQYTREDVIRLMKKFIEHAGNLVLFLQNVREIELLHWPQKSSEACLFYRILRSSNEAEFKEKYNVLELANSVQNSQNRDPVQKKENVIVSINIYNVDLLHRLFEEKNIDMLALSSKTEWLIFWQVGTTESYVTNEIIKKHVIVGGTASPVMKHLQKTGGKEKGTKMPFGFYSTGHVFCFLPLPQQSFCPVHVNGYFAVEQSRRRLVICHTDNVRSEGVEWNKFLLKTVVCQAYLNMLEVLPFANSQINCYDNWPFLGQDDMMNELVISFYEKLATSSHNVFYIGEKPRYPFIECVFLDPALRYELGNAVGRKALECFLEFNSFEPKHAMDLPEDVYNQVRKIPKCFASFNENICGRKEFFLYLFFPNLSKNFWDNFTEERNQLILNALQMEDKELNQKITETACIPTKPHGKLRRPSGLVYPDPLNSGFCISNLFSEEDERFPREEFSTSKVVEKLKAFGMMIDTLSNELVIDRVKSIQRLSSKSEKSEERCRHMLQYLEQKIECHLQIQNAIQSIKFLPVLQKPPNWPFTWYSNESRRFESGKKLCLKKCRNIVGSVRPIVNLNYKVDQRVLKYLGLQDILNIEERDVINQFQEMTKCSIDYQSEQVWEIFEDVYKFLDRKSHSSLSCFKDRCCILTKSGGLVKSNSCALELNCDLAPFLFKIDERWRSYKFFLKNIGVEDVFSVTYLVEAMKKMNLREGERSNHLSTIVKLLNMLSSPSRSEEFLSSCDLEEILLPDNDGIMRRPCNLCIDDERKLSKDNAILFVNKNLNTWTTSLFGIKSKSAQFIKRFAGAVSFGQSESLITRLKGILEDCPYSVSILNELIQNADDAGATEIHFVHDQRSHPIETIFDKSLAETQGPSLVVFNNSCFSKNDIEGISKLGEGSKRSDPMATGQFGIGFNAVYHITDVPSFLTIGETVPNGGALVMFDPHCKYVPLATPQNPGMMLENIQMITKDFPDMYNAYLTKQISAPKGTWFRFPLRTESMAKTSKIRPNCEMTNEILIEWFYSLREDIRKSLIFLSNIVKISLSMITVDGKMEQIASVSSNREQTIVEKLKKFNQHARKLTDTLRSGEFNLGQTKGVSAQYIQELIISTHDKITREIWGISHVCGTFVTEEIDTMLIEGFRSKKISLSPRAGVAFHITTDPEDTISTAFNFLPLPIQTKLPVHVNAHFAVDSARTTIFGRKKGEDIKEIWNDFLLKHAIPYAYLELICYLRDHLFDCCEMNLIDKLFVYNNAFPISKNVENSRWTILVEKFYKIAFAKNIKIFPIFLPPEVGSTLKSRYFLAEKLRKDTIGSQVMFLSLKNDGHQFSPYFIPLETNNIQIEESNFNTDMFINTALFEVANVLKQLGLKLLDSSAAVALSVQKSLEKEGAPPYLQRTHVIDFLRSWNSNAEDKCLLSRLGVPISETILKDIKTVWKILTFVLGPGMDEHFESLEGVPLCVQSDNILQIFSNDNKLYVSHHLSLLPKSAQNFLHKDLVDIFLRKLKKCKPFLLPLTIKSFTDLLENDPELICYKNPVPLTNCAPDREWFLEFWSFMAEFPITTITEESGKALDQWCLIPAKSKEALVLYPFKLRFAVLETKSFFEEQISNKEKEKIGRILSTLNIPTPSMELIGIQFELSTLIRRICASAYSPQGILECLLLHRVDCDLCGDHANALLMFLIHKLHDKMNEVKNKLKALVLYESYDGTLTSLESSGGIIAMTHNSVPACGLASLSKHRPVKIIKANKLLYQLYESFSVREIDCVTFYKDYFLKIPQCFDHETRMVHIEFINDNELFKKGDDTMKNLIRNFPFVKNAVTNHLQTVTNFVTPYLRLSRRMCTEEELLPLEPFRDEKWKEFLFYAGLKSSISKEMLLQFALMIEQRQSIRGADAEIMSDSRLLITEILKIPDLHTKTNFLQKLRTIKFLIPAKIEKVYRQILTSFGGTKSLISFENSVYVDSKVLVWSTCKILPNLKWQMNQNWNSVAEILLIKRIPDVEDVISHVHKLCYKLDSNVKKNQGYRRLGDDVEELHCFMGRIYTELKTLSSNKTFLKKMKTGFSETPLFYNKEKNCFLRWDQVVLEHSKEEEISNYLCRGSEIYGAHFEFFRELGVTDKASLLHYARVFCQLKSLVKERTLIEDEFSVCQKAMDGFLMSIEKNTLPEEQIYEKLYEFQWICLPSDANKLEKSSNLTIIDVPELGRRLKNIQHERIQYVKNAHANSSRYRLLLALPEVFRPKCVSQQVREVVQIVDMCESTEAVKNLNKKFSKKEFIDGLSAILSKTHAIGEIEKEQYIEVFQEMHFQQVSTLETILVCQFSNVEIQGTKEPQEVFYNKDESVVYLKIDHNLRSKARHVRDLAFEAIVKCTNGLAQQHRAEITRLLECDTIQDINDVLSVFNVSVESKWEPELGSYVPEDLHDFLEMSVQDLKPGEIVALEVLNPGLDDVTDYAYIYVKVLKKIDSDILPMYDINNGSNKVCECAYKLYRIVPNNESGNSLELEVHSDLKGEIYQHRKETIFKEIKNTLIKGWWCCPNDFKRIRIRILLNWHPDKHPNKPLATEVTQYVLEIIRRLKQGEFKEDAEQFFNSYYHRHRSNGKDNFHYGSQNSAHAQPMNEDNDEWMGGFFCRRRQRRRRGRAGAHKPANPQPQVGIVWFRQAKYNMKAALVEKENYETSDWDKGMNWICYKCHVVIETCLRSMIFRQDANKDNPANHDLVSLSYQLCIPELQDLCRKFQSDVYSSPDRMIFPSQSSHNVPGEMFTPDHVDTACNIAQEVIDYCDEQCNT